METEKGEIQWSTPTEHRKTGSEETNEKSSEGTRLDDKKDSGTHFWKDTATYSYFKWRLLTISLFSQCKSTGMI